MAARSTIQAGGFGWSGPLEDTSVAEVLERCAALRLSGLVELSDGGRTAMVNLVGGQVASSPSDTLENLRAWTQGRFRVIQCVPDLAGNLSGGIRLAGSLEEAAPAQLIRHLEVTALTADLELKGPRDEAARVRIAFGQIESIEVAGDRSPAAMRRLDGWRRGSFSIALRPLFAEDALPPLPQPLISAVKTEAMAAAAAPMEPSAVPGRGRETEVMAPLAAPPANPSRGRETEVMAPLAAPPANPSRGRGTEVMAPLAAPPANPHRPPRPVAPSSSSPSAASAGRRTAPSASVAGGGKGWLVVIAIGVGALLVAVALLVLLLRHEAPPPSPPTPPKAAAPTVASLPPEAAAKLDEARHHLLEGRKQKAVAAVAAAMVLAPDDPQVLRLRDMVEGTAGQGELVYGGHGAVVVDGVRFKGPRRIKVAAGPHRLGEGSEAVEIVVEAGGAHDVTGAE